MPVEPVSHSAVRGARTLLLAPSHREVLLERLLAVARHVELASDSRFQGAFAANMAFPASRLPAAKTNPIAVR